jgi:hypothetical protein
VKRPEKEPFALLGINSDSDREELEKVTREQEITWRSWWDGGGTNGPIATRWNVNGWPTICVLDAQGTIRYRGSAGLDQALDTLLDELKAAKKGE